MPTPDQQIDATMAAIFRKGGYQSIEAATPLSELIAAEEGVCIDEATLAKVLAELDIDTDATLGGVRSIQEVRAEGINKTLEFIFSKGPDPRVAMRRLYALAHEVGPQFIRDLTHEEMALLLGDGAGRATSSARSQALFGGIKSALNLHTEFGGNHKTAGARAKMSRAQLGNKNRLGTKRQPKLAVIEGGARRQEAA